MSCSPSAAIVEPHAPALAGGLTPSTPFRCVALHATIPVRCCIARQAVARGQRNHTQSNRGQGSLFPSCAACAQGAELARAAGARRLVFRGVGAGAWLLPLRRVMAQNQARQRLAAVGLLAAVPSMDEPPQDPDESPLTP